MNYGMVLAILAGVGIGGLAVQGIHAQTKPPAYYVVEIDAKNEDVLNKEWAPKADQTIKDAGGAYLVRSTTVEHIEGIAPKRILIIKWDNIDKLSAWRLSEEYMRTLPILDKAVRGGSVRSYVVEGIK
jgi:uncharacterized protein (DUF1330 family)